MFDIGRYDSPLGSSAFYTNEVMYAAMNYVGNTPFDIDMLNNSVMNVGVEFR